MQSIHGKIGVVLYVNVLAKAIVICMQHGTYRKKGLKKVQKKYSAMDAKINKYNYVA